VWRLGWAAARTLPLPVCLAAGTLAGMLYGALHRGRRRLVTENLSPLYPGDPGAARRAARRLFRHFGRKVADLLRFEAGAPVENRFVALHDWERFEAVRRRGSGILLLTPHLGNWEIGAPLLVGRGVPLLVVTQAEPGSDLTELRRRARARWGVETLVIGQDAFAFVELIRRLQDGATVAMLVDRPPGPSGVEVEFCGRPFRASVAPAELARASGCALLGVYLVARDGGYAAHVLPEFEYDRAALGQRDARVALTARIMHAFEPIIRRHADQWFHFVPIWSSGQGGRHQP
jgi:lauroyl/myristoyl acyltransferase